MLVEITVYEEDNFIEDLLVFLEKNMVGNYLYQAYDTYLMWEQDYRANKSLFGEHKVENFNNIPIGDYQGVGPRYEWQWVFRKANGDYGITEKYYEKRNTVEGNVGIIGKYDQSKRIKNEPKT